MITTTFAEKFTSKNSVITYLKLLLASAFYVLGIQSFLNIGGTFSTGLGAFSQLISFLVSDLSNYFSIIYIGLNIPLIIFFWKKVKKSFIFRTTFFLISQALIGMIYLIPIVHSELTNFMQLGSGTDTEVARTTKKWAILIYALIGSIFVGSSAVISWKNGGSTAGTDFIGYYYSTKKKKAIGTILFKISITIALISVCTTLIVNPVEMRSRENWLLLFVSTISYVCINSTMMNLLYPKYSKVKLEIHSFEHEKIINFLRESGFTHAYNIQDFKSGYTSRSRKSITSVVLLLEVKPLLKKMQEIDPDVWISEIVVRRVFGSFSTKAVEK